MTSALRRAGLLLAVISTAAVLAGCAQGSGRRTGSPEVAPGQVATAASGTPLPLRDGERRMTLAMPDDYTPSAPTDAGTDDYRCFLLDPHLTKDVWLTGSNVLPGNPSVVHHVILFRVPPGKVGEAEQQDAATEDPGWTCFGGTGLVGDFTDLDDASWLAAWAPGGAETKVRTGYGIRLEAGSRIVMQVHYNLLQGSQPDRSSAQLRWMDGDRDLTPLHTYLMPAPVELPCRPGHDRSPLCDRDAAVADVLARFGVAGNTNSMLHLLCGTDVRPGPTTSCTRDVTRGMTVIAAAGHMHLLGRSIRIESDPGAPRAHTLLDIPIWDFDDQGAKPIRPVHLDPSDTIRVTCHHRQWLRDRLPAFEGQEERYVVWGEGSTDEMCLGMLQVAFDDERPSP